MASIAIVLGYLLPVISLAALAVLITLIVGVVGYTAYEALQERRIPAGQVVKATVAE